MPKDCNDCGETTAPDGVVVAAATEGDLPSRWHAVLTVEGLRTTDHRAIASGALTWRQLPLPLFAQFLNAGHGDAAIVGQITDITRDEATGRIMGTGTFDLTIEAGRQAAQMCANQTLRWNSVDLEVLESQYVEVSTGGDSGGDLLDILFGEDVGEDGATDWYDEVTLGRIMGSTMVATPAFPQAVMAPESMALDIPEPMGTAPVVAEGLMAAAFAVPNEPPASWFRNPGLDEPTPMTITDDGRVFGHLALWNTCHTGFQDTCIVPPHSQKDYAYFLTGRLRCANGEDMPVGAITFDAPHAKATDNWQTATHHYDHTGSVAAHVNVGEDEHGVWFAGAMQSGLSAEDIRTVRASPLSGDWRKVGGGLELVAALAVNVPGFPIVASGKRGTEQVSLIAAAVKPRDPMMEMARELARIRQAIQPLMPLAQQQLVDRVNMGGKANPGTSKDKRLKENKSPVAAK